MNKTALALALSAATAFAHAGKTVHWGYTGHEGPEHWGELDSAFGVCTTGKNQSPVDIVDTIEAELPPLALDYHGGADEILNNGHTVQANFPAGSLLRIGGHRYELKQVHFHTPSENHIAGHSYPLEAHFVHADADGHLAVVGVMFEEGAENAALAALWSQMPMQGGERNALKTPVAAAGLLPGGHDYYRFNGSLTTPPCSEGVAWQVLKTPLTASKAQVEQFAHAVHGGNNRPIQPLNARTILN